MEQQNATPAQKGDLEVTGVSRSGRVRKKSSKLMDFQSPDEIETRAKKATPARNHPMSKSQHHQPPSSPTIPSPPYTQHTVSSGHGKDNDNDDDELMNQMDFHEEQEDSEEMDSDEDEDMDELAGGAENEEASENYVDPTVRRSIYMSEKSNKKKVLKDGKMVYGKAQRKDKGKTRFTAYMLWARDARKQMLQQQPDLDFGSISRRLGEMWANVPMSEKLNWKRRLKRYISKPKTAEKKDAGSAASKFLNKGQNVGSNSFGNNATNRVASLPTSGGGESNLVTVGSNRTKKYSQSEFSNDHSDQHSQAQGKKSSMPANKVSPTQVGGYKVTGIEPVDVAAHLKLLGDSLTIIGERLKEHEGQITVSGSLSVLLDSLLCSLGPLMCLTTQIPGFSERNQHLRDTLHNTLDNIAYVMPGL